MAASEPVEALVGAVVPLLDAPDVPRRLLAVYLLGFASGRRPARHLAILREPAPADPSWEVQEALAQAFDAYCASIGYEVAVPTIDAWLVDRHPNARRAVSEGLRPWTAKRRAHFARQPREVIRRLAALRADPSEYVRDSAGNALRDIRRAHADLVDAETATWDLADPRGLHLPARARPSVASTLDGGRLSDEAHCRRGLQVFRQDFTDRETVATEHVGRPL